MPLQRAEGPVYKPPSKRDPSEVQSYSPRMQIVHQQSFHVQKPRPENMLISGAAKNTKKAVKMDRIDSTKMPDGRPKYLDGKPKKKPGVGERSAPPWSLAGFSVSPDDIAKFEANPESMKNLGGIRGVAFCLRVDPAKGIEGTPSDVELRTEAFGPNTYPVKKPKIFLPSVITNKPSNFSSSVTRSGRY